MADKLGTTQKSVPSIRMRIADGGILQCSRELVDCLWLVQGVSFQNNLKVLPLGSYDEILGMDWLEQHSPMQIDWRAKTLMFQYQQVELCLKGVRANTRFCATLTANQVLGLIHRDAVMQVVELYSLVTETENFEPLPAVVTQLLDEFAHIFDEPKGLPPSRIFDRAIPLLLEAKPVNLCPYRYNPAQKDEIEKQVTEMLQQGITESE